MRHISALPTTRPLLLFFLLAYAIAWLCWLPLVLSGNGIGLFSQRLPLWTTLPGSYAPLVAALVVTRIETGSFTIWKFAPDLRRAALGLFLGCLIIVAAFVVLPSVWLTHGSLSTFNWAALAVYAYSAPRALLMAGPIGEEPGWRGFALPRLQAHLRPVPAALVLGSLWALWHAPLFLVPSWNGASPWAYFLLVLAFSFVMSLCFNVSRNSVLVAVLLHAMFNASSPVLGTFLSNAPVVAEISPDAILALSFAAVAVLLTVLTAGKLGLRKTPRDDA